MASVGGGKFPNQSLSLGLATESPAFILTAQSRFRSPMAAQMSLRWVAGIEATCSAKTKIVRSGLRLLARYQATGTAKKQQDWAPAR
eukprot:4917116-Pyramimonas_sp.AAC.1